jgi:hypothetical protein
MASANVNKIEFADGRELLTSYGVPVAGFVPGRGYVRTVERYSVTTSKHVNAYLRGSNGGAAVSLPDSDFRALFSPVTA